MSKYIAAILFVMVSIVSGCAPDSSDSANATWSGTVQDGPVSIPRGTRAFTTDVLLYEGTGAWGTEITSLKNILEDNGATYEAVSSAELNSLSLEELSQFGAIVFPGGYGNQITDSLSSATIARLREAVHSHGLNYVGFCAGSFIAVNPTPLPGEDPAYGLAIVDGPKLQYYYLEVESVKKGKEHEDWEMVSHSFADGTQRDILWYGGPVTPNIPGHVVAKYPTGDAAITQLWSGNGFVMPSATHPTATQSVYNNFGLTDSDGLDHEVAWKLVDAAVRQKELPAF